jgi:type II secretory pathway component PulF
LKQAVVFMRQAILDGNTEAEAMTLAGFPRNDCMIVRAAAEAGGGGKAFLSLAEEYGRRDQLASKFKKLLFMPTLMAIIIMIIGYASVAWLGPKTKKFLDQLPLDIELTGSVATFFAAVVEFQTNPDLYTYLYVGGCIGLGIFVKSRWFRWLLLDRIKVSRDLSLKSDLATLWGSFALLYDAGMPVKDACRVLSDAASREDTRGWFLRMGRAVDMGRSLREAVVSAGFPRFIVSGVKSALEDDSLGAGLANMVDNLRIELEYLSEKAAAYVEIGSISATAVGVGLVFMVTYYPMVSAALSGI